jgi:hypothetical protein
MKQPQSSRRTQGASGQVRAVVVPVIVPLIVAVIGALGVLGAAFFTDEAGEYRGRETMRTELQPTIVAQETTIAELQTDILSTLPITVTEIVYATPVPDNSTLDLEKIASEIRTYSFTDSKVITPDASLRLIAGNDSLLDYRLNFTVPENERSTVGLAIDLGEPTDITQYGHVEIEIEFSRSNLECSFILRDALGNSANINIGSARPGGKDVVVTTANNIQTIVIPLSDNFQNVNKQLLSTIFCVTGSDLAPLGSHHIILRGVRFITT